MRKRLVAIYSVLVVAIVLLAVLVPSCGGGGGVQLCTIEVKATLCDDPWEGDVQYTLTESGGSPINGTEVPDSFTVDCGNRTCAYVSGGPSGAYLESITPPSPQSVSEGGTITFTLNFELVQDAWIEFVEWTINGERVIPNISEPCMVKLCDIIDVHFKQGVDGCERYQVAVNETSLVKLHWTYYQGPLPPAGVLLNVVNDWCALNKTPEPRHKWSQVPSVNGKPVEPRYDVYELPFCMNMTLDVETSWQLVKCLNYTKAINWLGISVSELFERAPHPCVLFELIVPGPGVYQFTLQSSAEVALVDDGDVNPDNNHAMSPPLYVVVIVP